MDKDVDRFNDNVPGGACLLWINALSTQRFVTVRAQSRVALYESMDNSFQFEKKDKNPEDNEQSSTPAPSQDVQPLVIKDLRGVACPMNFVKTKMELSMIKPGEILRILLDDGAPVENVPGSVRGEGHTILDQKRTGYHWTVTIRKEG